MPPEYGPLVISLIFSLGCFTSLIMGAMFVIFILVKSGRFDVYEYKEVISEPRKAQQDIEPWLRLGYHVITSYVSEAHGKALVITLEKKTRRIIV